MSDLGGAWVQVFSGSYSKAHGGIVDAWSEPMPVRRRGDWSGSGVGAGHGDHVLEFLDSSGVVVASVRFDAEDKESSSGEELTDWFVRVVDPPEYGAYRIVRDDGSGGESVVFEFVRSGTAPEVSLLRSPKAGELVDGPVVELSWSASDIDGDDLSDSVYYSVDGGARYRPVCCLDRYGVDRHGEERTWSLDRTLLEGTAQARVMVVVSDGARWAAAESPGFYSMLPVEPEPTTMPLRLVVFANPADEDGIPGGAVAGARLAVVDRSDMHEWWQALAPVSDSQTAALDRLIPPGASVQISPEALESTPAVFASAAQDGTAEVTVDRGGAFVVCALSPTAESLVAGCSDYIVARPASLIVYVYFSHGRAYLSLYTLGETNKRYSRHEQPAAADPDQLAAVTVVATLPGRSYATSSGEYEDTYLFQHHPFAVIADADVGAWWDAVSDNGRIHLNHPPMVTDSELVAGAPARLYSTAERGIAELSLTPGDYLICAIQPDPSRDQHIGHVIYDCVYENILATGDNVFAIRHGPGDAEPRLDALSLKAGQDLLHQAQHWQKWAL